MKRLFIDTDESVRLDIYAPRFRTFDLAITLPTAPTGQAIAMAVVDLSGTAHLQFGLSNGLSITGNVVTLHKVAAQMSLPTGVYHYDLIQQRGSDVVNLLTGTFTVVPSYTPLA